MLVSAFSARVPRMLPRCVITTTPHHHNGRTISPKCNRPPLTSLAAGLPAIAAAAKQLKVAETVLRKTLTALGENADGGWRAEQKAAALAAWMVL